MSEDANTIREQIEENALGPQETTIAGMGHTKEYDLEDMIKAAKFAPPDEVKSRVGGGAKFTKATAGGSA